MISVRNLSKSYGPNRGIENVSFDVSEGQVMGFLGPNGAGKTTTMKILTCSLSPTSGDGSIAGYSILKNPLEVKKNIGYLPENPPVYHDMIVSDYLAFTAQLHLVPKTQIPSLVKKAVERCNLEEVSHRLIGNLSKGYKQRVGIAQAILHEPPVIILDEPTVGLDPNQIIDIRNLIKSLSKDHTIILCTHIMQEVQAVCDQVLIVNSGKIVANDSLENMEKGTGEQMRARLEVSKFDSTNEETLKKISGVKQIQEVTETKSGHKMVRLTLDRNDETRAKVAKHFSDSKIDIYELRTETKSLEDLFIELTQRG